MPGDSGATVVTNACAFYHCARGYGCNGHPAFPAPSWGDRFLHNSGALCRGVVKLYLKSELQMKAVMAGLVPAIHVFFAVKTWMPGTGPGMTIFLSVGSVR
jgi:hypothetical protein